MAKKLEQIMAALPAKRRGKIEARVAELATLKDLRQAVAQTQEELAATLGVGQDTISRLEKRSDMLLSTLRRCAATSRRWAASWNWWPNSPTDHPWSLNIWLKRLQRGAP